MNGTPQLVQNISRSVTGKQYDTRWMSHCGIRIEKRLRQARPHTRVWYSPREGITTDRLHAVFLNQDRHLTTTPKPVCAVNGLTHRYNHLHNCTHVVTNGQHGRGPGSTIEVTEC